jgi:hypothetical protein
LQFDSIGHGVREGIVNLLLLFVVDGLGWRIISASFDREQLITGSR